MLCHNGQTVDLDKRERMLFWMLLLFFFFFKHTALRGEIMEICIPSHQHFQTSPWTFTLDFAVWSFDAAAFLYELMALRPRILSPFWSCLQWHAAYQGCTDHTNNILLNQLIFVWSVTPIVLVRISFRFCSKPMRSVEKVDITLRLQFPQADGGRRPRGWRHLCSLYSGSHALLVSPPHREK